MNQERLNELERFFLNVKITPIERNDNDLYQKEVKEIFAAAREHNELEAALDLNGKRVEWEAKQHAKKCVELEDLRDSVFEEAARVVNRLNPKETFVHPGQLTVTGQHIADKMYEAERAIRALKRQ